MSRKHFCGPRGLSAKHVADFFEYTCRHGIDGSENLRWPAAVDPSQSSCHSSVVVYRCTGDGDGCLARWLDQAAGEGLVAKQETQPQVSRIR